MKLISHFEYWSAKTFYAPVLPYGLYLMFRARSLTYYTAVNPAIPLGGIMGESKIEILDKVAPQYLPKTLFFEKETAFETVLEKIKQGNFSFPIIVKPDVGERGNQVEKIHNEIQLKAHLESLAQNQSDFLVQEFIDYPLELGVLYYRYPDGSKSGISSLVRKEFLSLKGNGKNSVLELMQADERAARQIGRLSKKMGEIQHKILAEGETMLLEPIGNHSRGTKFLNENDKITKELIAVFDQITANIEGFYYGRFDMKVQSWEQLYKGEGIRILEINGVSSEPAHIYDPRNSLSYAYAAIMENMRIIYEISVQNHQKGIPYSAWAEIWKVIKDFWKK